MALTTWAFAFRMHQAASADGTTSQTPPHQQETLLLSLPEWQKMMKHPWRVKGDNKNGTKSDTQHGQIVSVDQLESNSPGFIAQLKGKLTQQCYKYATVFVDQFSGYTFIYLQKRLTSEETVRAKHTFECSVEKRGVKILYYHADNG